MLDFQGVAYSFTGRETGVGGYVGIVLVAEINMYMYKKLLVKYPQLLNFVKSLRSIFC